MSKAKEIQKKKLNRRLYPIYKMISWDLLFYYSIIFLFLTQVKNFTASQILVGEAFFMASCLILQIPVGLLVDKFGKKHSLIFGNACMCLFIITLLITQNFTELLIAYFIDAIGYVIKGLCETNILYDSLPRGKRRGSLYAIIDGVGVSRYYVVDAVTSLIAGFTYVINPYIPIVLCLIANIISLILSTRFNHTNSFGDEEKRTSVKQYFKELKEATEFVIKSKRILCLLIFFGLISGLLYNMTTFRSGILEHVQLPEQYFGLVLALSQIIAAICANAQNIIHKRFRNKTLSYMGITLTVSCIVIGLLSMMNVSLVQILLIVFLFVIQGAIKGPYYVLIYRYLNNFTNKDIRPKLGTIRNTIYSLSSIIISLLGALLLNFTNAANTMLIIGVSSTITMILILNYMKDKVGLKPDKYDETDLKYSSFKSKKL